MEDNNSKKSSFLVGAVTAAVMLVCLVTLIFFNVMVLNQNKEILAAIEDASRTAVSDAEDGDPEDDDDAGVWSDIDSELFGDTDGDTTEDGVVIAGDYEIVSTLPVSDAYKSGDTSGLSDKETEMLDMASEILDEVIADGMTDYEKEKAVYDWMVTNLNQDAGMLTVVTSTMADCENPYGTLKYHNAVCVGYATTFRLFMQMLDIPCMVVHNDEQYHSWDLVQIDGDWYHVDIYSDVGDTGYAHFNLNDEMQSQNEDWDTDYFPAATSLTYNYLYQNAAVLADVYEFPQMLRDAMDVGETTLALLLDEEISETDLVVFELMFYSLETSMEDDDTAWMYSSTMMAEGQYLVIVYIEYYEEYGSVDSLDLTEEELDKIIEAIENAFGDLGYSWEGDMGYSSYTWEEDEVAYVDEMYSVETFVTQN